MASTDTRTVSSPYWMPTIRSGERLAALDHLRGFLIGLVVLHHAVLAYCTFGHVNRIHYALSTAPIVDAQRWVGFDVVVRLNDSFFMPLLFLLSGLFVRDALVRKGTVVFLRARLLRLGVPFALAELTVVPLAYYPSFLQAGGAPGFARFWATMVSGGPWPSGPPWFIGVLLLFDVAAALVFALSRRQRSELPSARRPAFHPISYSGLLLAVSCLLYLPLLLAVGPTRWFSIGPLAIQGSRIGLYPVFFAAGVLLGLDGQKAIASIGQVIARGWVFWISLAVLTGLALTATEMLRAGASFDMPRWLAVILAGAAQATFCATACFAVPALFLRFGGRRTLLWDSLAANSFAIYLLHYPLVTWTQYGLLSMRLGALSKGVIAFAVALVASWAGAALLRRLPLFGHGSE